MPSDGSKERKEEEEELTGNGARSTLSCLLELHKIGCFCAVSHVLQYKAKIIPAESPNGAIKNYWARQTKNRAQTHIPNGFWHGVA
jgi:hypothetical protein